ncbi:MAG TPA: hypothetical protein VFW07_11275 [Parafilimonas sp.]|nr:hypothetical protein [Parafilimonas sp.]
MTEKFNILDELKENGAVALLNTTNKNYFSVPDSYFDDLAPDILRYIFIKSLPIETPFAVPSMYFEHLPDIILDKIQVKRNLSSFVEEKNLYAVPDGYFNSLAENILNKINSPSNPVQEELEEISPFLSKIPKTNVYSVPDTYFEQSLSSIDAANSNPQAKVISFGSRAPKWINYAAAACVAAVLFGGGYFYFEKNKNYPVSSIDEPNVQQQISMLSDEEIANYLEENNNTGIYTNNGDADQPQNLNIQMMLQNISDEEIQQYLNENPEAAKEKGEGI